MNRAQRTRLRKGRQWLRATDMTGNRETPLQYSEDVLGSLHQNMLSLGMGTEQALVDEFMQERTWGQDVKENRLEASRGWEEQVRDYVKAFSRFDEHGSPDRNMLSPGKYGKDLMMDADSPRKKLIPEISPPSSRIILSIRLMLSDSGKKIIADLHPAPVSSFVEGKKSDTSFHSLGSERTLFPYVTGASVLALKYRDGILMAADMGGSYGSTLRYKTVERIKPIGKHSLLGASGEISDFQEMLRNLDELILYDNMWDDGNSFGPKEVHNYVTRVMYSRRNKFNPLWNSLVLGGVKNGQKYLGTVSMLDGVKLLEKCMRVLLYRDRSAVNKLQIVKITEEGATTFPPYSLKTFWGFEAYKNPTVGEEGHHLKMENKNEV
ncbi:hypothetical protein NL676_022824 [Syzygium grande]|nr:hypothetical protein NL676_022824 [Syzygium grande]